MALLRWVALLLVLSLAPLSARAWHVPDIAALPDDEAGRLVRFGHDLLRHTTHLMGPDAAETARRFTGNGLECTNCHMGAGTEKYALPLTGVAALYPRLSARLGRQQSIEDRINDCMQRSMNGRPLPDDSREMKALIAYLRFIGGDRTTEQAREGRSAPALPLPARSADPQRGAHVYAANCAACHRTHGEGLRYAKADALANQRRYLFPPLWGPDSYNDAAGMSRTIMAAWFVHANMPKGITFAYPILTETEAYDVAAYINTQKRPHFAGRGSDYPDPWLKPADVPFPPLLGPFTETQRVLGPWPPIMAWLKSHAPHSAEAE